MKSILMICTLYFSSSTAMASGYYKCNERCRSNSADQFRVNVPQTVENASSPTLIYHASDSEESVFLASSDSEDESNDYKLFELDLADVSEEFVHDLFSRIKKSNKRNLEFDIYSNEQSLVRLIYIIQEHYGENMGHFLNRFQDIRVNITLTSRHDSIIVLIQNISSFLNFCNSLNKAIDIVVNPFDFEIFFNLQFKP